MWRLEKKISVGNVLVILALALSLLTWYVKVDAHVKDEGRHFDPTQISQEKISEELWYLRQRVDQIANYHLLPSIGVSSEQIPSQHEGGDILTGSALRSAGR